MPINQNNSLQADLAKIEKATANNNNKLNHKIPMASINTITELLNLFLSNALSKPQFIKKMEENEGISWFFVLDENTLLLRNYFEKVVINFNPKIQNGNMYNITRTEVILSIEKINKLNNYKAIINKKTGNKKIIAFSGVARKLRRPDMLEQLLHLEISSYSPNHYAILTGGYHRGVPNIAATIAKELGFQTIAVAPKIITAMQNNAYFRQLYDIEIIEGNDWGDESYLFSGIANKVILLDGGFWTAIELHLATYFKKEVVFLVEDYITA